MELELNVARENLASPPAESIQGFFNSIAPRYDPINQILSLGLDELWRKRSVELLLEGTSGKLRILDLGVGTGKFLQCFLTKKVCKGATGVDFAGEMLKQARTHLPETRFVQADIHELPFEAESFDLIISAFTLRSVKDRPHFFGEVRRLLTPAGRVGFLCLTRPTSWMTRMLYLPYLKFYLPFVGSVLSRDPKAYQFLSQSIQAFPTADEIGRELATQDFREIQIVPFSFGLSTLISAQK